MRRQHVDDVGPVVASFVTVVEQVRGDCVAVGPVLDLPVAGEAGVVPYVFVESVDVTLEKVVANDGEAATPPYPEGDLRVATFRDPAGNVIGAWQQGPAT